jgi:hypothetical protein
MRHSRRGRSDVRAESVLNRTITYVDRGHVSKT